MLQQSCKSDLDKGLSQKTLYCIKVKKKSIVSGGGVQGCHCKNMIWIKKFKDTASVLCKKSCAAEAK